MSLAKKGLVLISVIVLVISGGIIAENILGISLFSKPTNFSPQSANSTVYIQNGVSGIVTLTDPTINKTVNIYIDYYPLDSGSGVIVTGDGFIITAFHVVGDPQSLKNEQKLKRMDDNDIKQYLEEAAVYSYLSRNNKQLGEKLLGNTISNQPEFQVGTNSSQVSQLTALLNQRNLITVDSYKQAIKVKLPASNNINTDGFLNASLVDVGDSGSDTDIALLKLDLNTRNLPALAISSQRPRTGENIRIYGYPGNNTGSQYLTNPSPLTPSSSAGSLTSEISNSKGTIYYETNASVSEGYSGGPVVDHLNNVLGIVIYNIETKKFRQSSNTQFSVFLSAEYILKICNKNHIPINIV